MPRVLVLLAEGAEEMEVTISVDVLRRGGLEVVLAGLDGREPVSCSRGMRLVPDIALEDVDVEAFDVALLPGGMGGATRLGASERVGDMLRDREKKGAWIAAICAAPMALARHGVHKGRRMTSHPSVGNEVAAHAAREDTAVVVDPPLVTSQGPGTAFEFALTLVALLCGHEKAAEIREPLQLDAPLGPLARWLAKTTVG